MKSAIAPPRSICHASSRSSAFGTERSTLRIICCDMNMIAVSTTLRSSSRDERSESSNTVSCADSSNDTSPWKNRSEEHTSELQSLMRISYAVFCLKKKKHKKKQYHNNYKI